MNITTHSLQLYKVYTRDAEVALPAIIEERLRSLLQDDNEFSEPEAVQCWLYRDNTCSRHAFTLKRAESHCVLVPGTQCWQYIHEGDLRCVFSVHPAQHDLWLLTPAQLIEPVLRITPQAQGHPEVLLVERFIFSD